MKKLAVIYHSAHGQTEHIAQHVAEGARSMTDLRGTAAIVTGAAQGLGLAIARAYAAEGMRVALLDVNAAALEQAVKDEEQRAIWREYKRQARAKKKQEKSA